MGVCGKSDIYGTSINHTELYLGDIADSCE